MSFQDDSEINKDKILVISGSAEGVREAESIVRQLLEDHLPVISETIYIPRSAIKTVLGPYVEVSFDFLLLVMFI